MEEALTNIIVARINSTISQALFFQLAGSLMGNLNMGLHSAHRPRLSKEIVFLLKTASIAVLRHTHLVKEKIHD